MRGVDHRVGFTRIQNVFHEKLAKNQISEFTAYGKQLFQRVRINPNKTLQRCNIGF